ncbi:MAG: acetyl/propionyl/methylcrotonyl-CoA carboxylase subunit alpha [Burkholderiaceae bacterium]
MFTKILIANRGEIACRVAATAKRMAIKTVAVYSDADASAKHVAACNEAVHIGGSAPAESYLRWEKIIAAAQASGAQAIHPGYGFLSENAEFAQACADAGLVFIGPPPQAIRAMGLKSESKRLMQAAGVPLVPGYHGTDQDPALLENEAAHMGYPVLIKASAGGGGKGMRLVENAGDFAAALASCKREASGSFGNDAVLVERYVQRPRHIEIQVFGDTQGHCVYLFERDCSVQRRHQKVLEEAPAPGLNEALRQQMGAAAVAAARAVNYVGAGTVEFIVEQTPAGEMNFFFMEMNTRLQVEHPVTEAITGLDLVEWQLRVASGEALPLQQDQLRLTGHAIEARICAENPDNDFLPATGSLQVYRLPPCSEFERSRVRVDSGVRQGDAISPYYDSMVAKLIVHGDTREQALARLDEALAQTHIVGLQTNVQFLRAVAQSRSFAQADLDTALIPREQAVLFRQEKVGLPLAVAAAVASTLLAEQAQEQAHPFSRRDGFRAYTEAVRRFAFEFHGEAVHASLTYRRGGGLHLAVGAGQGEVQGALTFAPEAQGIRVGFAPLSALLRVDWLAATAHVFTPQGATQITAIDLLAHAGAQAAEGGRLTAPMPGKVVSFAVKAGDQVSKGQALAVMDAMKMEHTLAAPYDGTVAELLYAPGDQVAEGAELLRLVV